MIVWIIELWFVNNHLYRQNELPDCIRAAVVCEAQRAVSVMLYSKYVM